MNLNTLAMIAGIIGALVGLWIGYASYKDRDQSLAIVFGLLGAVIGAVVGAFLSVVILVIAVIALMLVALSHTSIP